MNKITIQGRLTRDVEVKPISEESRVYRLSVAVDRRKGKDGTKKTDFFSCDAWNRTGETISKYFHKGDGILLTGRMESSHSEKDGYTVTYWTLNVEDFEFPLGKRAGADPAPEKDPETGFTVADGEELPF